MASGSEVTCRNWAGDDLERVEEAQRTVNSVEIWNVTDGIKYTKLRTMPDGYAVSEAADGTRAYADDLITLDGAGNITIDAAVNVNNKQLHMRIIC